MAVHGREGICLDRQRDDNCGDDDQRQVDDVAGVLPQVGDAPDGSAAEEPAEGDRNEGPVAADYAQGEERERAAHREWGGQDLEDGDLGDQRLMPQPAVIDGGEIAAI